MLLPLYQFRAVPVLEVWKRGGGLQTFGFTIGVCLVLQTITVVPTMWPLLLKGMDSHCNTKKYIKHCASVWYSLGCTCPWPWNRWFKQSNECCSGARIQSNHQTQTQWQMLWLCNTVVSLAHTVTATLCYDVTWTHHDWNTVLWCHLSVKEGVSNLVALQKRCKPISSVLSLASHPNCN